ncbi:hypothetical protein BDV11DRAFT_214116 [Aspergillus similis]
MVSAPGAQRPFDTTPSKEAVPIRHTQPGLETVNPQGLGYSYSDSIAHGMEVTGPNDPHLQRQLPPPLPPKKMLWYWIVLGGALVIIVGLAAGLGVGLSKHDSDAASTSQSPGSDSDLPNNATTTTTTTAAATATTTTTTTTGYVSDLNPYTTLAITIADSSSSSSSSNSSAPTSPCPSANNTLITQSLGSKKYRIYCDSDFDGAGKKTLASVVLSSFEDCLALCNTMNYFQERSDVGATFNAAGTGGQTPGTCWCLGGTSARTENVGNDAAFPVDD